jgi:hypothetical protein
VKGLIADANIQGHVEYLVQLNKTTQWGERIEESPDGAGSYSIQKPAVDCQ